MTDLRRREGLGEIVERAALHRLDRGRVAGEGRHHHDLRERRLVEDARQHVEAVLGAEAEIEEGHLGQEGARQRDGRG